MSNIGKNWQIMPKIKEDFIKKYPEIDGFVLQLLFNRGITDKDEIDLFLEPDYEKNTHDPFLFNDMNKVVGLIVEHIKKQDKIVVYGDYDADGVTATALLIETLGTLKASVDAYIPNRVSEGYGLNKEAIDELIKDGAKLIITVDGGIRNKEEVEYAKSIGLDIIITDHHVPPDDKNDLPDCLIINPLVQDEKYSFKYLSGVGVAFKLAKAIINKSKLSDDNKKKLEERILDLVAIGTVADCVSLLGENRILVKEGLKALNKTKRIGLQELIKVAQTNNGKILEAWNIGFQIAPRLNAAGRMDHANTALELLLTKDKKEAEAIARRLNSRNQERQETTAEIVDQIINIAEKRNQDDKIIIAVTPEDEIWNEGVVGLVAGKISDKYYLPTLVITKGDEGFKGSGRSIEEFNVMEAIEKCSELFERYGGHPMACGFSFKEGNLDKFKKQITEIANSKLKDIDLKPRVEIEAELELGEVDEELIKQVENLAPFGQNNERPKFASQDIEIVDIITMGINGQHLKLRLKSDTSSVLSAVGFGQAEKWKELKIGDKIDIVYYAEMNEFNGRSEVQLKIIDINSCNM
jgi:single-stranded-DNA-specific exonuclease